MTRYKLVDTTVGRLIYNEAIPQDLGFVDRSDPEAMFEPEINFVVGKKQLGKIIDKCITKHGFTKSADMLDAIKGPGLPLLHHRLPDRRHRRYDGAPEEVRSDRGHGEGRSSRSTASTAAV